MSKDIKIKCGLTINLKGAAENIVKKAALPKSISLNPADFHLITPKMAVKIGDHVNAGDVVFYSKKNQEVKFCSPVSGNVKDIVRGEKRKIIEIIIDVDSFQKSDPPNEQLRHLRRRSHLHPLLHPHASHSPLRRDKSRISRPRFRTVVTPGWGRRFYG